MVLHGTGTVRAWTTHRIITATITEGEVPASTYGPNTDFISYNNESTWYLCYSQPSGKMHTLPVKEKAHQKKRDHCHIVMNLLLMRIPNGSTQVLANTI